MSGIRIVKLFCPSLSKSSPFVIPSADQKVDIGSISRAFGLDPSTVKLNGHYVSRGSDLISPSVTWAALLSYFAYKGLSTGRDDGDAVVVDGKLLKIGSKRGCECEGTVDGIGCVRGDEDFGGCRDVLVHRRLKMRHSAHPSLRFRDAKDSGESCSKRKCLLEDMSLLKRLKINDTTITEHGRKGDDLVPPISDTHSVCRFRGENAKRIRDDVPTVASPLKRVRYDLVL